jgi:hypothetical protein
MLHNHPIPRLVKATDAAITGELQQTESERAFQFAIQSKVFSAAPEAFNYAGNYMFMGESEGRFSFKHIDTRQYVTLCKRPSVTGGSHA